VINNRTFLETSFFEVLCKETNLYYFQNQGKYASSSKGLNGWPYLEAGIYPASQETPFLGNLKIHYFVHNDLSLGLIFL
jgi:hypothetical protein